MKLNTVESHRCLEPQKETKWPKTIVCAPLSAPTRLGACEEQLSDDQLLQITWCSHQWTVPSFLHTRKQKAPGPGVLKLVCRLESPRELQKPPGIVT